MDTYRMKKVTKIPKAMAAVHEVTGFGVFPKALIHALSGQVPSLSRPVSGHNS